MRRSLLPSRIVARRLAIKITKDYGPGFAQTDSIALTQGPLGVLNSCLLKPTSTISRFWNPIIAI